MNRDENLGMGRSLESMDTTENRLINHFFHDFKGGLATVIMCVEAVKDGMAGPVSAMQSTWLEKAVDNCAKMAELIADFRDLSQMEDGSFPREPEELDLAAAWRSLEEHARSLADSSGRVVRFEAAGPLSRVLFSAQLFDRLMRRLVARVVECASGNGAVTASVHTLGQRVLIDVYFEGPEFEQRLLDTTFDKLAQTEYGLQLGRGYAMVFCRASARYLGGDIRAVPWPERGNKIEVRLPFSPVPDD